MSQVLVVPGTQEFTHKLDFERHYATRKTTTLDLEVGNHPMKYLYVSAAIAPLLMIAPAVAQAADAAKPAHRRLLDRRGQGP